MNICTSVICHIQEDLNISRLIMANSQNVAFELKKLHSMVSSGMNATVVPNFTGVPNLVVGSQEGGDRAGSGGGLGRGAAADAVEAELENDAEEVLGPATPVRVARDRREGGPRGLELGCHFFPLLVSCNKTMKPVQNHRRQRGSRTHALSGISYWPQFGRSANTWLRLSPRLFLI
jgi:hypothetical protein